MDRAKAEEIIARQLPNFEVVEEVDALPQDDGTELRPSLASWSKFGAGARPARPMTQAKRGKMERLRKKFLGETAPAADYSGPEPDADQATSGTLLVKPKGSNATPKAVVVENGKIITRQG